MNYSKGSCDDVMSSDMLCAQDLGVYDESLERVWRRCDVVRHVLCPRVWAPTMNHSKGSCDDAMSSDMFCAQDFGGLTMNHSKGSGDDAMSSNMLCAQDFGG